MGIIIAFGTIIAATGLIAVLLCVVAAGLNEEDFNQEWDA